MKPEAKIRRDLIRYLENRQWRCEITHGSLYQAGFPDLYIMHPEHGTRWIDVKVPKRNSLTKAQRHKWPIWEAYKVGIWILVAATEAEYDKLFAAPNWREFWRKSYGDAPLLDRVLDIFKAGDYNET